MNDIRYGPSSSKLLNVYKMTIRSKLDCGVAVYSTASPSLLNTPEPVQNACLRLILTALPSSPVASLQALTGTSPLLTRRLLQAAHYSISDLSRKNLSKSLTDHSRILKLPNPETPHSILITANSITNTSALPRKLIKLLSPPEPPWRRTPTRIIWNMRSTSADHPKDTFDSLLQDFPKEICCFTDGSKSISRVGGAYLIDTNISIASPVYTQLR